jgi:hypothetical protein
VLGAALGVVLLIAGMWVGRASAHDRTRRVAATSGAVGPSAIVGGVPVGYAHSERGSAAAATTYLAVLAGPTVLDANARSAALDAVALPSARAGVDRTLTVDPAGAAAAGLPTALKDGSLIARTMPAGSRVRAYTPSDATVEVWAVSLLGTRTLAKASTSWSTTTVTLTWFDGDWKLAGLVGRPGPVPTPGADVPSRYDDLLAALADLDGYSYVPR